MSKNHLVQLHGDLRSHRPAVITFPSCSHQGRLRSRGQSEGPIQTTTTKGSLNKKKRGGPREIRRKEAVSGDEQSAEWIGDWTNECCFYAEEGNSLSSGEWLFVFMRPWKTALFCFVLFPHLASKMTQLNFMLNFSLFPCLRFLATSFSLTIKLKTPPKWSNCALLSFWKSRQKIVKVLRLEGREYEPAQEMWAKKRHGPFSPEFSQKQFPSQDPKSQIF